MTTSTTLPLEAYLIDPKVMEEIEGDELKSPHELLKAPLLLFKSKPTSSKFGRKSHQPYEESPKREIKKPLVLNGAMSSLGILN